MAVVDVLLDIGQHSVNPGQRAGRFFRVPQQNRELDAMQRAARQGLLGVLDAFRLVLD